MNKSSSGNSAYPLAPGESWGAPVARGTVPAPVLISVSAMYIRAALSAVSIFALFATEGTLRKNLLSNKATAATPISVLLASYIAGFVIAALAFGVLYCILAGKIRQGKNSARIAALVLAAITVCFAPLSFRVTATAFTRVVNLVGAALAAVVIVSLFHRKSVRYFRGMP
jgi:hypothetical protein